MNEIWKDVVGYKGLYKISNLGSVKSLKFNKEKVLTKNLNTHGYLQVGLSKCGSVKSRGVHQLVAEAFLNHKPCGFKLVVDHQNGVRTDNKLENLQIITTRENNSKDKKGFSSKYTGVSWYNRTKKWKAQITISGKVKYLGSFTDELKASEAYQKALKELIE